jgi:hypothetical protein
MTITVHFPLERVINVWRWLRELKDIVVRVDSIQMSINEWMGRVRASTKFAR